MPLCTNAGPASAAASPSAASEGGQAAAVAASGLQPFARLTKASIEALRYRGEDIARSISKSVVKEVTPPPH